jgi:hypothetical protein
MFPAKITDADDVQIKFEGVTHDGSVERSIDGTIDRVTGDVEAATSMWPVVTYYTLKCIPTRRMF